MLKLSFRTKYSVCSEAGDCLEQNQDSVFARNGKIAGHMVGMFLVADGCGGLFFGEKVSRLLSDSFQIIWEQELPKLLSEKKISQDILLFAMKQWIEKINQTAYDFGRQLGELVGSTATVLITLDRWYYILNVGDSRAYLYRHGELEQLTEDQSLLADMVRNRELSLEQREKFPMKNVLTMCIGGYETVQCFCISGRLQRGDIFLLCSDGLYHGLGEENLAEYMPDFLTEESAAWLRGHIAAGTAKDNVTALLVQVI